MGCEMSVEASCCKPLLNVLDDLSHVPGGEETVMESDATLLEDVGGFKEDLFVQEEEARRSLARDGPWLSPLDICGSLHEMIV